MHRQCVHVLRRTERTQAPGILSAAVVGGASVAALIIGVGLATALPLAASKAVQWHMTCKGAAVNVQSDALQVSVACRIC